MILADLARRAAEPQFAHTSSLLAAVDGVEVAAFDLHGNGLDTRVPTITSIGKSLLSTVAGWAWHDGLVSLDSTLHDLLGDRVPLARRGVTVHHLLSMTSGATPMEIYQQPSGWVETLLDLPQQHEPGTVFCYDNGAVHLLAAGLQRVVGGDLLKYAAEHGLYPLWPKDPEGVPFGFGGARLSPRALLQFGESWRTGTGVPLSYRERAWTAYTLDPAPLGLGYGYLWWIGTDGTFSAVGYGGQYVQVIPQSRMTIVTTGSRDMWRDGFSQQLLPLTG